MVIPSRSIVNKAGFYDYIRANESENNGLQGIVQVNKWEDSGLYEICLTFSQYALELDSYNENQLKDAILNMKKMANSFVEQYRDIPKRDLYETVRELHGYMTMQFSFPSAERLDICDAPDLTRGGYIGTLCIGPVLDIDTQKAIWGSWIERD